MINKLVVTATATTLELPYTSMQVDACIYIGYMTKVFSKQVYCCHGNYNSYQLVNRMLQIGCHQIQLAVEN